MDIIVGFICIWLVMRWLDRKLYKPQRDAIERNLVPVYKNKGSNYLALVQIAYDEAYELACNGIEPKPINPYQYDYLPLGNERLFALRPVRVAGQYSSNHYLAITTGTLLITSDAVVFQSAVWNSRLPWEAISRIELLPDCYKIHIRCGSPELYIFNEPNVQFAVMLKLFHEIYFSENRKFINV